MDQLSVLLISQLHILRMKEETTLKLVIVINGAAVTMKTKWMLL